jgi:hypothetical protein
MTCEAIAPPRVGRYAAAVDRVKAPGGGRLAHPYGPCHEAPSSRACSLDRAPAMTEDPPTLAPRRRCSEVPRGRRSRFHSSGDGALYAINTARLPCVAGHTGGRRGPVTARLGPYDAPSTCRRQRETPATLHAPQFSSRPPVVRQPRALQTASLCAPSVGSSGHPSLRTRTSDTCCRRGGTAGGRARPRAHGLTPGAPDARRGGRRRTPASRRRSRTYLVRAQRQSLYAGKPNCW